MRGLISDDDIPESIPDEPRAKYKITEENDNE